MFTIYKTKLFVVFKCTSEEFIVICINEFEVLYLDSLPLLWVESKPEVGGFLLLSCKYVITLASLKMYLLSLNSTVTVKDPSFAVCIF